MIIHTYEHDYPISSVKEKNEIYECYICRNLIDGGFCRIMSIKDKAYFPGLVSWLTETVNRDTFTDYLEHFNFNDTLCIVMKYTQGLTLADKLATESLSVTERAEIGRKILEKIVLQEIPDYFLSKCIDPECIIVSPDLTVNFNYMIDDIIGSRQCDAMECINKLLRLLFARELERKVPEPVIKFFDKLPELLELSVIEIYGEYHEMIGELTDIPDTEEEPQSVWYKIWNNAKKVWSVLKKLIMFALILLAAIYLIMTIDGVKSSSTRKANFDRIGTVTIDKSMS